MKKLFLTASVASIISFTIYTYGALTTERKKNMADKLDKRCTCIWQEPSTCAKSTESALICTRVCAKRVRDVKTKLMCESRN